MRFIYFSIGVFLALILGTQGVEAQKVEWVPFTSHLGRIKVKFPAKPSIEEQRSDAGDAFSIKTTYQEQIFMLTFIVHRARVTKPQALAKKALDGFMQASKGNLLSESEYKYKKHTGREALIELPKQKLTIDYRCLFVGNIQYQYMVLSPPDNRDPKMVKKFFKTFKVLKAK